MLIIRSYLSCLYIRASLGSRDGDAEEDPFIDMARLSLFLYNLSIHVMANTHILILVICNVKTIPFHSYPILHQITIAFI